MTAFLFLAFTIMNFKTDPDEIIRDAVVSHASKAQAEGRLSLEVWTDKARPVSGWGLDGFLNALKSHRASASPDFVGAPTQSGEWLDTLKDHLRREERFEPRAYHGVRSSFRAKHGTYVKPGHGSREEVSVGYGFNMNREGAREAFKETLGLGDADFDAVFNGSKTLTRDQAEKLLERDIQFLDNWLARSTSKMPMTDGQRIALLDLAYNAGPGNLKRSGILEAFRQGNHREAASRIREFNTLNLPGLKTRRQRAALHYLGLDAPEMFTQR